MVRLKELNRRDKNWRVVNYVWSACVITACLVVMIIHLSKGDENGRVGPCILTALCTLIPYVFELIFRVRLGNSSIFIFTTFMFVSSFIGSAIGVFKYNSVFDKVCHTAFGYFGCFLGLLISANIIDKKSHPWHTFLFCFLFVMACASLWEIMEFICDTFFGGTAQGVPVNGITPITDTMLDICVTFVGASIFFIHYLIHVKTKKNMLIDSFLEDNECLTNHKQNIK